MLPVREVEIEHRQAVLDALGVVLDAPRVERHRASASPNQRAAFSICCGGTPVTCAARSGVHACTEATTARSRSCARR